MINSLGSQGEALNLLRTWYGRWPGSALIRQRWAVAWQNFVGDESYGVSGRSSRVHALNLPNSEP